MFAAPTPTLFYDVQVTAGPVRYDLSHDVGEIILEENQGQPSALTLTLEDPYRVFGYALQEGVAVTLDLGHSDDHSPVFSGQVYSVDAAFPSDAPPTLTVRAHDRLQKLGLRPASRDWADVTLADVASSIASEHGFSGAQTGGTPPSFGANGVRQQRQTDLAFLTELAGRYGYVLGVESGLLGDVLLLRTRAELATTDPAVTYSFARGGVEHPLRAFTPRAAVQNVRLPRRYTAAAPDGSPLTHTATPDGPASDADDIYRDEALAAFTKDAPARAALLMPLLAAVPAVAAAARTTLSTASETVHVGTVADAAALAQLSANDTGLGLLGQRATGEANGNHHLRAASNIRADNVGGRFSGVWHLTKVTHTVNANGYVTTFEAER